MRKAAALAPIAALLISLVGCRPCGCSDADMTEATIFLLNQVPGVGATINGANFHFESPLIGDDTFTLNLSYTDGSGPHQDSFSGTYDESGGTITFKFGPSSKSQAIIRPGSKYTLTCDKKNKTLKLRGPGMTTDLVFKCRE